MNVLGALIRDVIYYPLYWFAEKPSPATERKMLYEKEYYRQFWSSKEPRDLNLENGEELKQNYIVRDQPIIVHNFGNKKITAVCRVIEPKDCLETSCSNVLILPGSLSTLDNNLFSFYDFLLAYSKRPEGRPVRLFIFGQYETTLEMGAEKIPYKVPSLDALGEILKRTLESLNERYGKFDLIYAHSAGCIALASLLKKSDAGLLPSSFHFDRGASSMFEASRNYWIGRLLYCIAKYSGLALDLDQEIVRYFDRCSKTDANLEETTCLITGVEEDAIYAGKANLARSERFRQIPKELKFAIWMFNPPEQINHARAHHGWRLTYLNKSYISASRGNLEMRSEETLAESILRLSQCAQETATVACR